MALSHQRPQGRRRTIHSAPPRRRRSPARYVLLGLLVAIVAAAAAAAVLLRAGHATLRADGQALARISLPFAGGHVQSISAVTGPHSQPVAVSLRGGRVWPQQTIPAGQQISLDVVIARPGWIGWLTGQRQRLTLSVRAPEATVAEQYVTVPAGAPLRVSFTSPVSEILYGTKGHLARVSLATPSKAVTLPHSGVAGSMWVQAVARPWESAASSLVSWFPAGARATAIASPAPGSAITPATPIKLTFSKPVRDALGNALPPVSPAGAGNWQQLNDHTLVFRPSGYGYGLGARVTVALPAGISLLAGTHSAAGTEAVWRVPGGSTLRLQQLLAQLGYLPLSFNASSPVATTPAAQEAAAVTPPAGSFTWRYQDTPGALKSMWAAGADGVMTRGAVMAFENDHGLAPDGDAGPLVWRAIIRAAVSGERSSFGYTFVEVDKGSQHLALWHDGSVVLTTAVNTGIAQAPTASGTFAVYEHLRVTTMSGTNPDGTHYHDPGIQFVSYFNGGDALHAFTRAQYGFPQSLGCVEMALAPAGRVWPYTPIGTLVHVV